MSNWSRHNTILVRHTVLLQDGSVPNIQLITKLGYALLQYGSDGLFVFGYNSQDCSSNAGSVTKPCP